MSKSNKYALAGLIVLAALLPFYRISNLFGQDQAGRHESGDSIRLLADDLEDILNGFAAAEDIFDKRIEFERSVKALSQPDIAILQLQMVLSLHRQGTLFHRSADGKHAMLVLPHWIIADDTYCLAKIEVDGEYLGSWIYADRDLEFARMTWTVQLTPKILLNINNDEPSLVTLTLVQSTAERAGQDTSNPEDYDLLGILQIPLHAADILAE